MKFLTIIFICLIGLSRSLTAANAPLNSDVDVRVFLEPDKDINLGQLVRFWVEITTSTRFTRAPHYPDLQIDGAISVMPEQLGVNFTDNKSGTTRVAQRQRYAVIPQRAGQLSIPSLNITLGIEVDGKPSDIKTLTTEPLSFDVLIPPGTENIQQFVSTKRLAAKEIYEGDMDNLKVGDAVTRKITVKADDMLAVALPAISFKDVDLTRLYPAQPILTNSVNRGQYSATRIDSATYILEKEGNVKLPAIKINWWDLKNKELKAETLPAFSFSVAPSSQQQTSSSPSSNDFDLVSGIKYLLLSMLDWLRSNIILITLAAVCIYLIVLASNRYLSLLVQKVQIYMARIKNSEFVAYLKLCKNILLRKQDKEVQSFWSWLDSTTPENQSASLEILTRDVQDRTFNTFVKTLTANRYSSNKSVIPGLGTIFQQLNRFRKKLLKHGYKIQTEFKKELNPRG